MASTSDANDSLKYLDPAPTIEQRAMIEALIRSEIGSSDTKTLHPSVTASSTPMFSPSIASAHDTIAQKGSFLTDASEGVNAKRYEEVSAPADTKNPKAWRESLAAAYTLQAHLDDRKVNLELLDRYGKNAWLLSNFQVENELRSLEKELKASQMKMLAIEEERRLKQEACAGEIQALEDTWKRSLGRAIEAEVETERLRKRILEARRNRAGG